MWTTTSIVPNRVACYETLHSSMNVLPFCLLPDMTAITKIAVSFHFDTDNASSTHSYQPTVVANVKIVTQKVGKDPEQSLAGCFAEYKIDRGVVHCLQSKNKLPVS